ncbi:hypothetical protein BBB02_03785 [Wolbachia endosymbiont of Bemisia tabaci]|nr:hypothetical protein BBB02_03785 [Wolbachia endosymbiont of Bemisia tabaci]
MKRRSPWRGGRHVTHISAYKIAWILHALRQAQCGQQRSARRETHSAYKTVGILPVLRQIQCGQRGAAAEVKIIKPHLCLFFLNFFVQFL